ncbi:MAG TPA: AI-2E family transporter [Candidatus Paceibacterota bacterium]
MSDTKIQNYFYVLILLLVATLFFFVIKPFVSALLLAIVMAVLFRPLYEFILGKVVGRRESLAALLTILLIVLVIFVPLGFLAGQMVGDVNDLYTRVTEPGRVQEFFDYARDVLSRFGLDLPEGDGSVDVSEYAVPAINWVINHVGGIFSSLAGFTLTLFVALLGFFSLLKDGPKLKDYIVKLSPVADRYDEQIFDKMRATVNSVIRGALMLALIQGVIATVGYLIFSLPQPILWGGLTAISALVPGIGTALVVFPAAVYLLISSGLVNGLGLMIWGMLAVGLVDNFLGPKLMGRGVKIHSFLILISVVGGLQLFGPIGFIAGPLVLSLFIALLDIYPILARHGIHETN